MEYQKYKILGLCNPSLAKRTLDLDKEGGDLLSCNVVIYEYLDQVQIFIQKPIEMMKILGNENINEVAKEAKARMTKVIENLQI